VVAIKLPAVCEYGPRLQLTSDDFKDNCTDEDVEACDVVDGVDGSWEAQRLDELKIEIFGCSYSIDTNA
jgi:hypothetical protein